MSKIAILYICTGKYDIFWKDFYISSERYFLVNHDKEYFVFTDASDIYGEKNNTNIHKIYQENLGWPDNTLMRYHMFYRIIDQLRNFDYIYFFNSNCEFLRPISDDEFLPNPKELLVVKHPGYYKISKFFYPYERRKKSTAYIRFGVGKYYICGGVNGGTSSAFIELIETMIKNIDIDKKNNIIAKWHDESQINKYIVCNNNYRVLSPSYCYPEDSHIEVEPIILIRDKGKYFDVDTFKNKSLFAKFKSFIRKILQKAGLL